MGNRTFLHSMMYGWWRASGKKATRKSLFPLMLYAMLLIAENDVDDGIDIGNVDLAVTIHIAHICIVS